MTGTRDLAAAIDVGGTKVAGGLISAEGRIEFETVLPSEAPHGTEEVVRTMAAELIGRAGARLAALGAGYPEYVAVDGRLTSCEVIAWSEQPLQLLGRLARDVAICVDSDVRCAARAESAHHADPLYYVALGTGLSSALVIGGQPYTGARGEAIALGELSVGGWDGNLESFVSGAGIARRLGVDGGARAVERRAAAGDPRAAEILQTGGEALGRALAGVVGILDPATVVLGGGFGSVDGIFAQSMGAAYARETSRRPGAPPLVRSRLDGRGGMIGAGLAAFAAAGR